MTEEPPYGYDDGDLGAVLRGSPPCEAVKWAESVVGAQVQAITPLRGGMAAAMHLLTTRTAAGEQDVVLRRYVLGEGEFHSAVGESRNLRLVAAVGLPTPRLLGEDLTGQQAGVPSILMTRLPGNVQWAPGNRHRWCERLAEVVAILQAHPVDSRADLPAYKVYRQKSYLPPAWSKNKGVWERAVAVALGPLPDEDRVLLHRDFHPGNVLWTDDAVSGVIDWQTACVGPPSADVGHCRENLLPMGPEVVATFTRAWEASTGRTYHPWGDIVTIIGWLDGLRTTDPLRGWALEDVLAAALAELG